MLGNVSIEVGCAPLPVKVTARIIAFLVLFSREFVQISMWHCYWEGAIPKVCMYIYTHLTNVNLVDI